MPPRKKVRIVNPLTAKELADLLRVSVTLVIKSLFAKGIIEKAGLRHRPSYQLRHTFASLCLANGVTPGWLANVLGHSTLQTLQTLRQVHKGYVQRKRTKTGSNDYCARDLLPSDCAARAQNAQQSAKS